MSDSEIKKGFSLPIGPIHIALEEPATYTLHAEGAMIKSATIDLGHVHRSIEYLSATKNFWQIIPLVERVCGI